MDMFKKEQENAKIWAGILFIPGTIILWILYYDINGGDIFEWLGLDYLFLIPLISIGISYVIGFVLSIIFGIPRRKKEKLNAKNEKQKQLEFEENIKPYILAQKYLDKYQIGNDDINNDDFIIKTDNIFKSIENNRDMYEFLSLNLDEQYEYLKKVPSSIINIIKENCKKMIIKIENEKNTNLRYYCSDEEFETYKQTMIDILNNEIIEYNEEDEYETLKTIQDKFYILTSMYLFTNPVFYNSYIDLYLFRINCERKVFKNKNEEELCFLYSDDMYYPSMAEDYEIEEKCENIIDDYKDIRYKFLYNNLTTDFYQTLKSYYICIYQDSSRFYRLGIEENFMLYLKRLITTYLSIKHKKLLLDYTSENFNRINKYDRLYEELDKDRGIIFSGVSGEKMVEDEFNIYKDELEYFSNIRFEEDDLSVETDGLIVSERGLFSIEIKNFKFPKIKISKDGQWKKCYYGAGGKLEEEVMKDVGSQINRHIIITERLFNKHLKEQGIKEKIEIKPMIIIANNDIEIENDSDMVIVRTSQIYNNFKKSNCNYSKKAISEIKKYIKNNKLPAKKYEIINYEKTFENITNSLLENRNKDIELFNEILRVLNEDLPKDLEENMSENNI